MHQIVVLGAGTGGTLTANRLRRAYKEAEAAITVVDQDDRHVYQPGLLFVPFGLSHTEDIVRPRGHQLHDGIDFVVQSIDSVDLADQHVLLTDGRRLPYDVLVVATGAVLAPEETEGLTGEGWGENVFTFYDLQGSQALADRLEWFEEGRFVVNVIEMPIKCPVAPLEFCFLADWFFQQQGVRRPYPDELRDPARRCLHEARCEPAPGRDARGAWHQARDRVQYGHGRRSEWKARLL